LQPTEGTTDQPAPGDAPPPIQDATRGKWLRIDPDSLAGKIYLLILDKLVLGAVIALAFVVYDRWKTDDQRQYDDKVTLAFQRANYVKELVPIVTDPQKDLNVRVQALIALIETRAIGDKAALVLTERLLQANLLRSDYPEHFVWNREHPLLDALELRMPNALGAFLEEYESSRATLAVGDQGKGEVDPENETVG
jgi:hypothetical protein